jgi:hypothetical protein
MSSPYKRLLVWCCLGSFVLQPWLQAQETHHRPDNSSLQPGSTGLEAHPFLYAGEWDYRKPEQTLFIIRDGKVEWSYSIPIKTAAGVLQEWGDATLLSNGNILFSRKTGAGLVSPDKKLLWNYDAPPGTEVHVAQPIGLERAFIVQNGDPATLRVVNLRTGIFEKEMTLPTGNPGKPHGQFRCVRRTPAGTYLVTHMDWNRVAEYDESGKEIWALAVLSPWAALRLPNGNTLVSSNRSFVREFTPEGRVAWEYTREDAARAGIQFYNCQGMQRLRNGNTVISSWCANGIKDPADWPSSVQFIEVTPDKKIVWALRSWEGETDLGPATTIQLLDEPGVPENGELIR